MIHNRIRDPDGKDLGYTRPETGRYFKSQIHKIIIDHDLDFGPVLANGQTSDGTLDATKQEGKNINFKDRHAMDQFTFSYFKLKDRNQVGYSWEYVDTEHGHLVIDGQNHNINFASMDLALWIYEAKGDYQEDWSSTKTDCLQIDIEDKVTAKSVPYYYKYNNYIYKTQQLSNPSDQQIFQCY